MKTIKESTAHESGGYITDRYFYHAYSHPTYRTSEPRIPRSMAVKHPYQVDYNVWKKIIKRYFELLLEKLLQGGKIELPSGLGSIELGMVKRLGPSFLAFKAVPSRDNMSYVPTLFWYKNKGKDNCSIKNKRILSMQFFKPTFMKILNMSRKDPYMAFRYVKDPASDNVFVSSIKKFRR